MKEILHVYWTQLSNLQICGLFQVPQLSDVANQVLGKTIFVSWPHLYEAKVISVTDGETR